MQMPVEQICEVANKRNKPNTCVGLLYNDNVLDFDDQEDWTPFNPNDNRHRRKYAALLFIELFIFRQHGLNLKGEESR